MELVLHFGNKYLADFGGKEEMQPTDILVGQITNAIRIKPTGHTGIFAIRFQPWGLHTLTGIPAEELKQQFFKATDILGNGIAYLQEQMDGMADTTKVAAIENYLLKILVRGNAGRHRERLMLFEDITRVVRSHGGNLPVSELAAMYNVSSRHFNRSFNNTIGVSPKQFSRIVRLQRFMDAYSPEHNTLTTALHSSGYYDQAHFIREFREIAGIAPSAFFKDDNEMANLMLI